VDACLVIPGNLQGAEKADKPEQRPIGTEIPAPEVLIEQGKDKEQGQ